ncbi:hypothetical protein AB7M16_004186 [Bradyrhizobium sp. USDA 372]
MKLLKGFASVLTASLAGVAAAEEPPRLSLQSTSDFASYGAFYTDLTALYSPFGTLWEPGWRVEGITSARRYSFVEDGQKRVGLDATLDVLAGYQFTPSGWSWLVAAGVTGVNSHVYAAPGLPRSDAQLYGLKVLTSLYGKPTDQTMVYVQAHYNTASEFYYAQGKTGIAIAPNIFVGPEAAYSGSWTYNQLRLGGHITGFTVGSMNTGVSLGYVSDSNYGKGVYGGLNFQINF